MSEKEILIQMLCKVLNIDQNAVTSLLYKDGGVELKPDALTTILNSQSEFVSKLKKANADEVAASKDSQHKLGFKEGRELLEKELREKYGINSDAIGVKLVDEIITTKVGDSNDKTITEDDVKKSKLYNDLLSSSTVKEKEFEKKLKTEVEKVHGEYKSKETIDFVNKRAVENLMKRNPVLSKDAEKAKNQLNLLLIDLKNDQFEIQGDRILVMENGKVKEDNLGHPIQFDDYINNKCDRYYDFQDGDNIVPPANPADVGRGTGGGKDLPFKVTKPSSQKELLEMNAKIETSKTLTQEQKETLQGELMTLYKSEDGK